MPIVLVLAMLALSAMSGEARAAKAQHHHASTVLKLSVAKQRAMCARHSLRWITTHMHNYKNARQYHAVIEKFRGRLFHWRAQIARLTKKVQKEALAALPPHYNDWMCIHRYEGAWNDSGAPYYGGLQMDWSFMHAYGGWLLAAKGTADNWTPMEQMWVAERALAAGRGFYPWPNTARMCGLI